MTTEVYDIQCLGNCFVYTGYSIQEDKWNYFIINENNNDCIELYEHLFRDKEYIQVGFNCISNNYPILHYIVENNEVLFSMERSSLANNLYRYSQQLKTDENKRKEIIYGKKHFYQIDLYKIWYFVSKEKTYEIEDLKFAVNFHDMSKPKFIQHGEVAPERLEELLEYSKNNVQVILDLLNTSFGKSEHPLYRGRDKIGIRDYFSEKYKLDFTNSNDVEIVEKILLKSYCKENNVSKENIIKSIKPISKIWFKECIPEWLNLKTNLINGFNKLKDTSLNLLEKSRFNHVEKFNNIDIEFTLKGIQGCIGPGIYEGNGEKEQIISIDIKSMFPSIAKALNLRPSHLNQVFNDIYGELTDLRIKSMIGKEVDYALSESLKRGLNAVWGKFGKEGYWMYDPVCQYSVSIAGMSIMCMFLEDILSETEFEILVVNTDGIIIKVPANNTNIARRCCSKIESQTGLEFRFDLYDKITILSKDDYLLEDVFDVYGKGCFDLYPGYAKSSSSMIIPIALKEYFRYNKSLKDTICNHKNIYDFCVKTNNNAGLITRTYYCKNEYGEHYCNIIKDNMPEPDYDWYVKKAGLIISKITQRQQKLF